MRLRWLLVLSPLLAFGCAEGGGPGDGGRLDGGGGTDAPPGDAPRTDGGRPDGGTVSCPTGQHACGTGCIADLANDPTNGCRLGCGEACVAPTMGTPSCTAGGTCDFTCPSPFRRMGDGCVCMPMTCTDLGFECGSPDDGCGTPLDCGGCGAGTCVMGRCGCAADMHEPNDGNSTATPHPGSYDDADDPDVTITDYNLDAMDDSDWIRFTVVDGFDGGNPRMTVTLDNVPVGADYDLAAYFVCDSGGDSSSCNLGTVDDFLGRGCADRSMGTGISRVEIASECSGIDENGVLYVRVTPRSFEGCGNYRLQLNIR
jgi:hypothetical protein